MSSAKVLHKKSDVSGRIPQASDVDFGEIAINYNTDDKGTIFAKLSDGTSMASFRSESYNDDKYISKSEDIIDKINGISTLSSSTIAIDTRLSSVETIINNAIDFEANKY